MDTEGNWDAASAPRDTVGAQGLEERARETTEKARSQLRSLAETGREELAEQLGGLGRALTRAGEQLREEDQGQIAHYSATIGEKVQRAGRYLGEHDTNALIGEVERVARRQPVLFLGGCLAIGFTLGRLFKASPVGGEVGRDEEMPGVPSGEPAARMVPSVERARSVVVEPAEPIVAAPNFFDEQER